MAIQRWGNSLALRIPKTLAEDSGLRQGVAVDLTVERGRLVAAPVPWPTAGGRHDPPPRIRHWRRRRTGSVVSPRYVPSRGDVAWLALSPVAGHEQAGRRPALVISPLAYNRKVGLALFCPVTSKAKGYPFEVDLPGGLPIVGVVLADHVKRLDWRARRATFACRLPVDIVAEVLGKLGTLIEAE